MENIKRVNLQHEKRMHMKIYGWLLACVVSVAVHAQDKLVIMGKLPDLYIVYPASGTESLLQISNRFGFSVSKLSSYNKINVNPAAPFARGTGIRIPVNRDVILQHPAENSTAVVHIIKKGENLYRVSALYDKVPLASLREWNHLKKDIVKQGQALIIGYMINVNAPAPPVAKKQPAKEPSAMPAPIADAGTAISGKKITPVSGKQETDLSVAAEKITNTGKKEEKKTNAEIPFSTDYIPKEGDEGYYAAGYAAHGKEQTQQYRTGDASTFKTISGWTDRKFYVLMNEVAPKTIVRIKTATQKSICAMVLGPLSETKGASGLLLRVSNSAASALGITDQKFIVEVTFFE